MQVLLDARDRCDIGGVARQYLRAHRHAVARDRQRDDDLRLVVAAFLAVPALAQRCIQLPGELLGKLVRLVDLEIGRRGILENQINIEPQQIGRPQEHVSFNLV
jgi:hypothetical protein